MYSQGYKAVEIAKHFAECGYHRKNGKLIDHKYLYVILHNKRYTGVVEHQGEVYDNIFPRIITEEIWNKVNAINEENKLAPSRKKEIFDYILSGKLIYGECKHKMGDESGTSHTGDIHYYYICLSKRKKRAKCNAKPVHKQWLEDTVINATSKMLGNVDNIRTIANAVFQAHKKETADNTTLKLLERKQAEAVKAQNNIVRAIEQGIITETTKSRLTELETLIAQYDFDILKEKVKSYTFLTVEQIEMYLSKFVFEDTSDIKVRKLLVNTFIREVILYDDRIVVTYNFIDTPEHIKFTKEHVVTTEKEIERAEKSAFSSIKGSYIFNPSAPKSTSFCTRLSISLHKHTSEQVLYRLLLFYSLFLLYKIQSKKVARKCDFLPFPFSFFPFFKNRVIINIKLVLNNLLAIAAHDQYIGNATSVLANILKLPPPGIFRHPTEGEPSAFFSTNPSSASMISR